MSTTHKLPLSVQYATTATPLPTRAQFRRWLKLSQQAPLQATIRIVDETEARALNQTYRNKNYATNVLTFTLEETPLYGDIILCAPVITREAKEQRKDLLAHYAHLTIHAALHLQGYDHETAHEASVMEQMETALLAKLGYADPYRNSDL
jgi:probable rRNA maturation factor